MSRAAPGSRKPHPAPHCHPHSGLVTAQRDSGLLTTDLHSPRSPAVEAQPYPGGPSGAPGRRNTGSPGRRTTTAEAEATCWLIPATRPLGAGGPVGGG